MPESILNQVEREAEAGLREQEGKKPPQPILDEMRELSAEFEVDRPIITPQDVGLPPRSAWRSGEEVGIIERFQLEGLSGLTERVPFFGGIETFGRLFKLNEAAERLRKAQEQGVDIKDEYLHGARGGAISIRQDMNELAKFHFTAQMLQTRGTTLGADVTQTVADLAPIMAEFLATGGAAGVAKEAAKKGVKKVLVRGAKKGATKLAKTAITNLAGVTASGLARTALMPQRVMAGFANRRLPAHFQFDAAGNLIIGEPKEGVSTAFLKAFGDVLIENISEESGQAIGTAAGAAFGEIPGARRLLNRLRGPLQRGWMDKTGKSSAEFAKKAFSKVGFDGILEEMGEERLGDVLRAALNVEDFGTGAKADIFDRLIASIPNERQVLTEALAFGVPGAARGAATRLANRAQVKEMEDLFVEDTETMRGSAQIVLEFSEKAKDKEFAQTVLDAIDAGDESAVGLRRRVLRSAGDIVEKLRTTEIEETVPSVQGEVVEPEEVVEAPPPVEERPAPAVEAEVPVRAVPPTVPPVPKPAPPALPAERVAPAPKIEKPKPVVKKEVAVIPTEPVSEQQVVIKPEIAEEDVPAFAKEITRAQFETEQEIRVKGKDLGIRIFESGARGKRGGQAEIGSSYITRVKNVEKAVTFEEIAALQMVEADQTVEGIVSFANEVAAEGGQELRDRILQDYSQLELAPVSQRKRKKVFNALDFQPKVGEEAGGLAAAQVKGEFDRLRKFMPKGLAQKIMQEAIFWKEGTPLNVTPKKLKAFAERARFKPRSAFRLGEISAAMQDRQILEFIKEKLPKRQFQVINKALEQLIKARTPGQRVNVIASIQTLIDGHNKASALLDLKKSIQSAKTSDLRPEFKTKLDALLKDLVVKKPRRKTIIEAVGVMATVEREAIQTAKDQNLPQAEVFSTVPIDVIRRARSVLERVGRRPLTDLTTDELRDIQRAVDQIRKQSDLKNQMLAAQMRRTAQQAVDDSVAEIEKRHGEEFGDKRGQSLVSATAEKFTGAAKGLFESYETAAYRLGGDGSTIYRVLYTNMQKGQGKTIGNYQQMYNTFRADLESLNVALKDLSGWSRTLGGRAADTVRAVLPDARQTLEMTRAERISFFLNWADPETRAQILKRGTEGIRLTGAPKAIKITARDAQAIIDSMDSQERGVARSMSEIVNGPVKEALNNEWRRLFGYDVATKENYWRRRRDIEEGRVAEPNQIMQAWATQYLENQGIFKERVGAKGAVVIEDAFKTFDEIIGRTSNFIGKAAPIHDALRLVRDPAFRNATRGAMRDGGRLLRQFEATIQDFAGMERSEFNVLERMVNWTTRNATVAVLAVKPTIVAYQTISLISATNEIDAKFIASSGLLRVKNKTTRDEIQENSPRLWARITGSGHEIVTPGASLARINQELGARGWSQRLQELGMKPIHLADTQVMYRIWRAAKLEMQDKGFEGDQLLSKTADRAEQIVDRTQPTWDPLTVSSIQRLAKKTPLARLIPGVLFSSQRNKNVNMLIKAFSDFAASGFAPGQAAKFVRKAAVVTIINALLLTALKAGWDVLLGGAPEDEKDKKKWIRAQVATIIKRTTGNFLVAGDILNYFIDIEEAAQRGTPPWFVNSNDNILQSTVNEFGQALWFAVQALKPPQTLQQAETRKKQGRKAINSLLRGTGNLTGLPIGGIQNEARKLLRRFDKEKR